MPLWWRVGSETLFCRSRVDAPSHAQVGRHRVAHAPGQVGGNRGRRARGTRDCCGRCGFGRHGGNRRLGRERGQSEALRRLHGGDEVVDNAAGGGWQLLKSVRKFEICLEMCLRTSSVNTRISLRLRLPDQAHSPVPLPTPRAGLPRAPVRYT